MRLVEAVREHFPNLPVLARARNVGHYIRLRSLGVDIVERETFESALALARKALVALGVGAYEARERSDRFRRQNVDMLEQILPHWHDEQRRTQLAIEGRQQLEEQMQRERAELDRVSGHGWHANPE